MALHLSELIKYKNGRECCSYCGKVIPIKQTSKDTSQLLEWQSVEVMGLFCSELCAVRATSDNLYRTLYPAVKGE
jgi:hypothetical protein